MNDPDQARRPGELADAGNAAGPRRFWLLTLMAAAGAAIVSACKGPPPAAEAPIEAAPSGVTGPIAGPSGSARSSSATSPKAYRQDGATHLYGLNAERIYKGKLPPLLYAVGVLNVEIDRVGRVTRLDWLRAPRHAPEVMKDIEAMIQQASPFPAPTRLGKVTYTDTWLWHKSGKFQLDTLTEGQT
jgi:periplasmic protein TonB